MTPHPTNTRAALRRGRREVRRPGAAGSASSRSTRSSRTAARSASPTAASRPRRAATTAASAPTRSTAATSSRPTSRPASRPASRISGINAEVMPGQWEFQVGPLGPLDVGRPAVARPLAALPHRRGLRHRRHARPEAGQGRLERRRRAHQLLDQGDARGLRRRSSPRARRSARTPSEHIEQLRRRHRATASPACTRPPRGTSSATACPTAAPRCASRGRSRWTRRATSRTAGRTPTAIPYVVTRLIVETCCGALEHEVASS